MGAKASHEDEESKSKEDSLDPAIFYKMQSEMFVLLCQSPSYDTFIKYGTSDNNHIPGYVRRDVIVRCKYRQQYRRNWFRCSIPGILIGKTITLIKNSNGTISSISKFEEEHMPNSLWLKFLSSESKYLFLRVKIRNFEDDVYVDAHANMLLLRKSPDGMAVLVQLYDPQGSDQAQENKEILQGFITYINKFYADNFPDNKIQFRESVHLLGCNKGIQNYLHGIEIGYCSIIVLFVVYIAHQFKIVENVELYLINLFPTREELYSLIVTWTENMLNRCTEQKFDEKLPLTIDSHTEKKWRELGWIRDEIPWVQKRTLLLNDRFCFARFLGHSIQDEELKHIATDWNEYKLEYANLLQAHDKIKTKYKQSLEMIEMYKRIHDNEDPFKKFDDTLRQHEMMYHDIDENQARLWKNHASVLAALGEERGAKYAEIIREWEGLIAIYENMHTKLVMPQRNFDKLNKMREHLDKFKEKIELNRFYKERRLMFPSLAPSSMEDEKIDLVFPEITDAPDEVSPKKRKLDIKEEETEEP